MGKSVFRMIPLTIIPLTFLRSFPANGRKKKRHWTAGAEGAGQEEDLDRINRMDRIEKRGSLLAIQTPIPRGRPVPAPLILNYSFTHAGKNIPMRIICQLKNIIKDIFLSG